MDVSFVPIPTTLVHKSPCLRERMQGFLNLTCRPIGVGEEGKAIWSVRLWTAVLGDHESVRYLSHALFALSVLGERPAILHDAAGFVYNKSLLVRQCGQRLCQRVDDGYLTTQLMDISSIPQPMDARHGRKLFVVTRQHL